METLSIKISSEDLSMLRRIAKAQNRRFNDFLQLVFADGLHYYFCDEYIEVEKLPEEYTEEEIKQKKINSEIMLDDKYHNMRERRDAGFIDVSDTFDNRKYNREKDSVDDFFIEPIASRLRDIVTD